MQGGGIWAELMSTSGKAFRNINLKIGAFRNLNLKTGERLGFTSVGSLRPRNGSRNEVQALDD